MPCCIGSTHCFIIHPTSICCILRNCNLVMFNHVRNCGTLIQSEIYIDYRLAVLLRYIASLMKLHIYCECYLFQFWSAEQDITVLRSCILCLLWSNGNFCFMFFIISQNKEKKKSVPIHFPHIKCCLFLMFCQFLLLFVVLKIAVSAFPTYSCLILVDSGRKRP